MNTIPVLNIQIQTCCTWSSTSVFVADFNMHFLIFEKLLVTNFFFFLFFITGNALNHYNFYSSFATWVDDTKFHYTILNMGCAGLRQWKSQTFNPTHELNNSCNLHDNIKASFLQFICFSEGEKKRERDLNVTN